MRADLWDALDRVIASASAHELAVHRLEALGARRLRVTGRAVPPELARAERTGALLSLLAPALLARVREACDGPILVLKGPETAAYYPDPALRPYRDLDLVVPDPGRTQRQLVAAGFAEKGDVEVFAAGPHERPLHPGDIPLFVEVHHVPNWPRGLEPPTASELFAVALPASYGLDDVFALPPPQHALVLAAHAWTHGPVMRLRDLVDFAALVEAAGEHELRAWAKRWHLERLVRAVRDLTDAVLDGGRPRPLLRPWSRNLTEVRERTVFESHVGRWLSGFSTLPPHRAVGELLWQVASDVRPQPGETWGTKARRTRRALANLAAPKSEHDRAIDAATEGGARLPPRRPVRLSQQAGDADDRQRDQEQHGGEHH